MDTAIHISSMFSASSVQVVGKSAASSCRSVPNPEEGDECLLFRLEAGCLKSCQSQALGLCLESNGSIML
ncbi:uncharacterized, partial [Tachysurus ichikawai]